MSEQTKPRVFDPRRAAELAVGMKMHTDLDDTTIKQLGFAMAEAEEKWNAARKADEPMVTISRLGLYVLLMTAMRFTGMNNEKEQYDPSLS